MSTENTVPPADATTQPAAAPAAPVTPPPAATPPATETLILGKFKSTDDLAAAYKALEAKLGQRPATPPEAKPATSLEIKPPDPLVKPTFDQGLINGVLAQSGLTGEELLQTFAQTGKLTDEQYAKLAVANVKPADANQYLKGQVAQMALSKQIEQAAQQRAVELAGGVTQLQTLLQWAGSPLAGFTPTQVESLNARLAHPETYESAINEIKYTYAAKNGAPGDAPMLRANAALASGTVEPFRTKHEASMARKAASEKYGEGKFYMDATFMARLAATEKVSPNLLKV